MLPRPPGEHAPLPGVGGGAVHPPRRSSAMRRLKYPAAGPPHFTFLSHAVKHCGACAPAPQLLSGHQRHPAVCGTGAVLGGRVAHRPTVGATQKHSHARAQQCNDPRRLDAARRDRTPVEIHGVGSRGAVAAHAGGGRAVLRAQQKTSQWRNMNSMRKPLSPVTGVALPQSTSAHLAAEAHGAVGCESPTAARTRAALPP